MRKQVLKRKYLRVHLMLFNLNLRIEALLMLTRLEMTLKHPENFEAVVAVAEGIQRSALGKHMMKYMLSQSGIKEMIQDKWRPAPIDLNYLEKLPKESLGFHYVSALKAQGVDPNKLFDHKSIDDDKDFILHRLKETHDIIHVLTGFGTDEIGELGIQAFQLAQTRSPLALLLIFGVILKMLQDDDEFFDFVKLMHALSRGFEAGATAKCVSSFRLEEAWEKPLNDWKAELSLP